MWLLPHARRLIPAAALLLIVLAAALAVRPAHVRADDGCDPSEPVACIPLPEEQDIPGAVPAAPFVPAPGATLPGPPCPPIVLDTGDGVAPAAPLPPVPRGCPARAVLATVNAANVQYVRAVRTLGGPGVLPNWGGEALAMVLDQVAALRAAGRYATPSLLSISVSELHVGLREARVRTVEHWLYQERSRRTDAVVLELDQWVVNRYELRPRGGDWIIVRDDISLLPAPPPPPPPPPPPGPVVHVVTDRERYRVGETVTATITNTGSSRISAATGYACGMVNVEVRVSGGWQPVPPLPVLCIAALLTLNPGASRPETVPDLAPGTYRLVVRYTVDATGRAETAYSAPFTVLPGPPPPLEVAVRVTTDRVLYDRGDTVVGTITNEGTVTVAGGGGFGCGLLRLEYLGPNGWERAPIPEPLLPCTLLATLIRPGESRSERLPTGPAGVYRLAFDYSPEGAGSPGTAYSAPYVVR
jgi:hypothetical protein